MATLDKLIYQYWSFNMVNARRNTNLQIKSRVHFSPERNIFATFLLGVNNDTSSLFGNHEWYYCKQTNMLS